MNTEQERDELVEEIAHLIDLKIRAHEIRVGWISGAIGLALLAAVSAFLLHLYQLVGQ